MTSLCLIYFWRSVAGSVGPSKSKKQNFQVKATTFCFLLCFKANFLFAWLFAFFFFPKIIAFYFLLKKAKSKIFELHLNLQHKNGVFQQKTELFLPIIHRTNRQRHTFHSNFHCFAFCIAFYFKVKAKAAKNSFAFCFSFL